MQTLGVLPSHVVKFTVGLFCMENFAFDELAKERLEKELDFSLNDIIKMNIKEGLIIDLVDGRRLNVPFEELDSVVRPACLACTDFANDFADLSVGGLGASEGYTTTILRTEIGIKRYNEAVNSGYIKEFGTRDPKESQINKTKTLAKIISFAERKRERGLNTLKDI
jgi:coenzyme F420 hydrogenase subunit beta